MANPPNAVFLHKMHKEVHAQGVTDFSQTNRAVWTNKTFVQKGRELCGPESDPLKHVRELERYAEACEKVGLDPSMTLGMGCNPTFKDQQKDRQKGEKHDKKDGKAKRQQTEWQQFPWQEAPSGGGGQSKGKGKGKGQQGDGYQGKGYGAEREAPFNAFSAAHRLGAQGQCNRAVFNAVAAGDSTNLAQFRQDVPAEDLTYAKQKEVILKMLVGGIAPSNRTVRMTAALAERLAFDEQETAEESKPTEVKLQEAKGAAQEAADGSKAKDEYLERLYRQKAAIEAWIEDAVIQADKADALRTSTAQRVQELAKLAEEEACRD